MHVSVGRCGARDSAALLSWGSSGERGAGVGGGQREAGTNAKDKRGTGTSATPTLTRRPRSLETRQSTAVRGANGRPPGTAP